MTEQIKRQMLLEERYATLMSEVRAAYSKCVHMSAEEFFKVYRELPSYLRSLIGEMEEIEVEIGERLALLYPKSEGWWIS